MDANVGAKILLIEEGSAEATAVLAEHMANPSAYLIAVPDLFHLECANIVWKAHRRGEVSAKDAGTLLREVDTWGLVWGAVSELRDRALAIACEHNCSAYDASYLALAEKLKRPLVTADARLMNGSAGKAFPMMSLADYTASEKVTGAS
jgi:predicted nucleic acid-binding protein